MTVTLSSPPRAFARSTSALAARSRLRPPTCVAISSSLTWRVRPSEQSTRRSPGNSSSTKTSGCTPRGSPTKRVIEFGASPEWSAVSRRTARSRTRYARLSPRLPTAASFAPIAAATSVDAAPCRSAVPVAADVAARLRGPLADDVRRGGPRGPGRGRRRRRRGREPAREGGEEHEERDEHRDHGEQRDRAVEARERPAADRPRKGDHSERGGLVAALGGARERPREFAGARLTAPRIAREGARHDAVDRVVDPDPHQPQGGRRAFETESHELLGRDA